MTDLTTIQHNESSEKDSEWDRTVMKVHCARQNKTRKTDVHRRSAGDV